MNEHQLLPPVPNQQCGALCIRHFPGGTLPEVLLVTSRGTRRWIIPKGWYKPKKKPHQVARIEAWEEAGVRGQVQKEPFGFYTYRKWLDQRSSALLTVQVHLLFVSKLDGDFPEKEERDVRWFSPEDAAAAVAEPELKRLIASAGQSCMQNNPG